MLSLLLVPVRVSEACVPVTLRAHTIGRGDCTDNTPSSNTDVNVTVVDNSATIIVVAPTIVNIKTSFDIYYLKIELQQYIYTLHWQYTFHNLSISFDLVDGGVYFCMYYFVIILCYYSLIIVRKYIVVAIILTM